MRKSTIKQKPVFPVPKPRLLLLYVYTSKSKMCDCCILFQSKTSSERNIGKLTVVGTPVLTDFNKIDKKKGIKLICYSSYPCACAPAINTTDGKCFTQKCAPTTIIILRLRIEQFADILRTRLS